MNGFESPLTGIYEAFDSAGNPVEARFIDLDHGEMRLLLLDPLYVEWQDPSTGALCAESGFPGFIDGQELLPDVPIVTTSPHTEQVILTSDDGTNRLRVTLEYVLLSSGAVQVEIQSIELDVLGVWTTVLTACTIPGNPFVFGKIEDAFCE